MSERFADHSERYEQPTPQWLGPVTNLQRAESIIRRIDSARAVQRELKSAFARSELDGGAKAALVHPLYLEAQDELDRLHDDLMILI